MAAGSAMEFRMTAYIRKCPPKGAHKSWRFQRQNENGSWTTIKNEEIDALNRALKDKENPLSERDIEARAEAILQSLYRERDKDLGVELLMPGNLKIFEDWWSKFYTQARIRKMKYAPGYLTSERGYFLRALKAAGNVPVDGDDETLQEQIDAELEDDNNKHHALVSRINRIRKSLKLPLLIPARKDANNVDFVTRVEFEKRLNKLNETYRILAAVAFYTALPES
jgi:hypothetical protein